ncbi:hypothetical protein QVD17_04938 [Tagetes erecta]|uniref:Uncharacterized protein n=1 Tax=Tagetes erecta TaxID=13708 RepID=A0AAD8LDK4_TARER|nr:hypothetical protein QVD17_04938 [Tagetes erecta]
MKLIDYELAVEVTYLDRWIFNGDVVDDLDGKRGRKETKQQRERESELGFGDTLIERRMKGSRSVLVQQPQLKTGLLQDPRPS